MNIMKKIFCLVFIFMTAVVNSAMAGSIDPAVYKTMTGTSYRENYRLNTQSKPIPYWQTQANPITRDNSGFMNYETQRFNQDMSQYKYNMKLMRGY